jgi:fibrillarin-like rRNA methylase
MTKHGDTVLAHVTSQEDGRFYAVTVAARILRTFVAKRVNSTRTNMVTAAKGAK